MILAFALFFISQSTAAAEMRHVGEISCQSVADAEGGAEGGAATKVVAQLYGNPKANGFEVKYADLTLLKSAASSSESSKESSKDSFRGGQEFKVIHTWGNLPEEKGCYYCYQFKAQKMNFLAWPKGLGEKSVFSFEGQSTELECRFRWFRNWGPVDQ